MAFIWGNQLAIFSFRTYQHQDKTHWWVLNHRLGNPIYTAVSNHWYFSFACEVIKQKVWVFFSFKSLVPNLGVTTPQRHWKLVLPLQGKWLQCWQQPQPRCKHAATAATTGVWKVPGGSVAIWRGEQQLSLGSSSLQQTTPGCSLIPLANTEVRCDCITELLVAVGRTTEEITVLTLQMALLSPGTFKTRCFKLAAAGLSLATPNAAKYYSISSLHAKIGNHRFK